MMNTTTAPQQNQPSQQQKYTTEHVLAAIKYLNADHDNKTIHTYQNIHLKIQYVWSNQPSTFLFLY